MEILLLNTTLVAIVSLILLCLFLIPRSKNVHPKEAPTLPGAWPVLGHLPLLSGSKTPHKTLAALADQHGPIFTIKLGSTHALVISNSETAKECYTKNDIVVSSRPKPVAVELMSYNQAFIGWAPYGSYWREIRKVVKTAFLSNSRIEQMSQIRVSEIRTSIHELVDVWSNSKNNERQSEYVMVELKQWFAQLTLNMILRLLVGERYFGAAGSAAGEEKAERCLRNVREFMRLMGTFTVADAVPWLRWLDFGGYEKAMKKTAEEFDKMLSEWLAEHRQRRSLSEKGVDDRDFIDVMLSVLKDREIEGVDADTIYKATTLELILGGSDTTAGTLTWAMSLLLRNPHTLEKAKEELDMQIGKEKLVTETDISKLVYLQAIVKETLRMYPPAPLSSPREFTEDCTLGGYHVKKGTRLIPNLWKIHRDPSVWTDPLEFKPERFLTTHKGVDVKGHHFELLPFGSGRRICAGMSLGLNIVHFTLANFLQSFEILNPSSEPIDMTEISEFTTTRATPLEILVKPRLPHNCYETM